MKQSKAAKVVYLRAPRPAPAVKAVAQTVRRETRVGGKKPLTLAPKQPANSEGAVIQIERELLAAIKDKNMRLLSQLLAHDFVYRSPYTKDLAKSAFLETIQNSQLAISKIWFGEMKVSLLDKVAIINGVQKAQVREQGDNYVLHQTAFSDVLVYRHGRWLLASSYGVELPHAPKEK